MVDSAVQLSTVLCSTFRLQIKIGHGAARENQFPNRDCQRGALRCEIISCDAMTSDFVCDLFISSRSSGHRFLSSGVRTKQMEHA